MTRPTLTRASSSSTLSCITVGGEAGEVSSVAMSIGAQNTDNSSVSALSTKGEPPAESGKRVMRARKSVESYNAHVLSSTVKKGKYDAVGGSRAISGQTLVDGSGEAGNQLLGDSIKALDPESGVDAVDAEHLDTMDDVVKNKRRRSTRLEMVDRVASMTSEAAKILGKRSRDVVGQGKAKFQSLKGDRRNSLRPREGGSNSDDTDRMPTKKPRLSGLFTLKGSLTPPPVIPKESVPPKRKVWLSQGLYVGQDRDFDPRLTESKNKLKAASRGGRKIQKENFFPLPMFAGQRLLDRGRTFKLPFDVFAPLPPGQPKPEEWRKTQKNVFIGDAAGIWKKNKLQEVSRCICKPDTGCDEDCQNRFMFYECDDTNCKLGAELCTNRSFEDLRQRCKAGGKYNIGVEVIKTLDRGYGVRSNRTFAPNQIIVEYAGEIITQDESDERMNTRYKDNECYYLMLFDQNMIIDATRGSIARFVNHSCEPNCRMIKWTVMGKPRMALFAGDRGVMSGEELTYDYNFDPFSAKNVQVCRCGALKCRGFLGPKPKDVPKPKEVKNPLKALVAGSKRKLQQVFSGNLDDTSEGIKKRKLAVPASAKAAIMKGKAALSRQLAETYVNVGTNKAKAVKKTSGASLSSSRRSSRRTNTISRLTAAIQKGSNRKLDPKASPSLSSEEGETQVVERRASVKVTAASVRRNVVRTVRGSRRAVAAARIKNIERVDEMGKTIKIINTAGAQVESEKSVP
ncbi:MAG: hypothetical protein M1812_005528 [Candelaria pacifica]|nr:MAG: hypothetical protein M1812_005528 [Candelaria pacifica]